MNIVKDYIFPENKLGSDQIEAIVSEASGSAIDLSDVYIQYTTVESWTCEDGIVKNGSQQIDSGYGIRAISNEKTGFSYGNNFEFEKSHSVDMSLWKIGEANAISILHDYLDKKVLEFINEKSIYK